MSTLQIVKQPLCEPILLAAMKNYLRVDLTDDDALISGLITAGRELVETFTGRSLVNKTYLMTLDSFPYFVDTAATNRSAPVNQSYPAFASTYWNYAQMIRLLVSPLYNVNRISYLSNADSQWRSLKPGIAPWFPGVTTKAGDQVVDGNGNIQTATTDGVTGDEPPIAQGNNQGVMSGVTTWSQVVNGTTVDNTVTWRCDGPAPVFELQAANQATTFIQDKNAEPPRIFPGPAGAWWPTVLYVPNAVQIELVAGYGDPTPVGSPVTSYDPTTIPIPGVLLTAIQQLVAGWYENRESITPLNMKEMPNHVKALLWSKKVPYFSNTRG
jgi:hypothetical protein